MSRIAQARCCARWTATIMLILLFTGNSLASRATQVELRNGIIVGHKNGKVREFKGIPYAEPPVGDLRWRPPRPKAAWRPDTLDASEFGHNCLQDPSGSFMGWPMPLSTLSEDCLFLNVYAPSEDLVKKNAAKVPVMLWIHGGGFIGGGGNETRLNGTWDVALTNGQMCIVTINYRLGAFGFLAADELRSRDENNSTGNYGIQDQRLAMKWVQDNIAEFGCDPQRVFIVGQSAGAMSVSQHLVRPQSWGLFSSAGMESGAFYDNTQTPTVASSRESYLDFVKAVGCSPDEIKCLTEAPWEKVLKASMAFKSKFCSGCYVPVVDGVELAEPGVVLASRGLLAKVPILIGGVSEDVTTPSPCDGPKCTEEDVRQFCRKFRLQDGMIDELIDTYSDEVSIGNFTRWYWVIVHSLADSWSNCQARRVANWVQKAGQKAFYYRWEYAPKGPNGRFPDLAHHAVEQPFVFHVMEESKGEADESGGMYHIEPEEAPLSEVIVNYWMGMASRGSPTDPHGGFPKLAPDWPSFDAPKLSGLVIGRDRKIVVEGRLRSKQCNFWDKIWEMERSSATLAAKKLQVEGALFV
eukprot:TRINITY_DN93995_c0_g1_i1.p1 TRINITY_DN93995_c0_g1~~TRINITY_DN93995_c0_g1_i1.p1  ORF type:complete len:580 (+),score=89.59 TRINITY_DN93995_c0_g1_i1:120-1859(+)